MLDHPSAPPSPHAQMKEDAAEEVQVTEDLAARMPVFGQHHPDAGGPPLPLQESSLSAANISAQQQHLQQQQQRQPAAPQPCLSLPALHP